MSQHPSGYCPVFGNYPKEYNRAVHGPYYPWRNYGPADTHFSEVKLGEFRQWFARRNKTPQAIIAAASRMHHLYFFKWVSPRYAKPSKPYLQTAVLIALISLLNTYPYIRTHKLHKYHW